MNDIKKQELLDYTKLLRSKMSDNIVAIALGVLGDVIGGTVIINSDDMDLLFRFINCLTVSLCGVFSVEQIYELLCNYIDIKK